MKTKTHFRKVLSAGILLSLLVLVVMSCKKKDDDVTPSPNPNPPTPPPSNVFQSGFHKLMTDEEIQAHKKFGGTLFYSVGAGLSGDDPELPFGEVAKTLFEVYDYEHTTAEFKQIDNELSTISSQVAELQTEIQQLSQQLSMVQTNIMNKLNSLLSNTYVTLINTAYDSSTTSGLRYYSKTAAQIQNGQYNLTMHQLDSTAMKDFIPKYGPSAGGNPMPTYINEISTLVLGATTGTVFGNSSLKLFADEIIQAQSVPQYNQTYAMNCYKLLENYFLINLNSQVKAFTIWANALYRDEAADTVAAKHDYDTYLASFTTILQEEMAMYLTVADYLSINLLDYRTSQNFSNDLTYWKPGLRPDEYCGSFIARANMLNQLVTFGLGVQTKDVYVTVSVPKCYSNAAPLTWTAYPNSFPLTIDNGGSLLSRFAYTGWTTANESPGTSYPDNVVTFYRANDGNGGSSGHVPLTTLGIGINGVPWRTQENPGGSLSFGYYNPNDITAPPQGTWSKTFCLPFASGSACWYWGYLWFNDDVPNNMFEGTSVNWQYPTGIGNASKHNSPYMMENDDQNDHTPHYGGNFNWGDTHLGYSGTFPTTSGSDWLLTGQFRSAEFNADAGNASYNNTISVYFNYAVNPFNWSRSSESYFAGTDTPDSWTDYSLLKYYSDNSTKYSESGTLSTTISSGAHTFNVGFYTLNPGETGNSNSCNITWYSQVVYNGTYNIWSD